MISGSPFITNLTITNASSTLVQGNLIGLVGAESMISRRASCVEVFGGSSTTIGGTSPKARNVIAGGGLGVFIRFDDLLPNLPTFAGNLVQGNYIGTDSTGLRAVGNQIGVFLALARGTTVGGATAAAGNLVSGNQGSGIVISTDAPRLSGGPSIPSSSPCPTTPGPGGSPDDRPSTEFQVLNNDIGTDVVGAALPNGGDGVRVELRNFSHEVRGNRIAFNGRNGVAIPESSFTFDGLPAFSIRILDNSIFSNANLGIDLGDNGITANDFRDTDSGANLRQNFPELGSVALANNFTTEGNVIAAATFIVNGTFNSIPNRTFDSAVLSWHHLYRFGRSIHWHYTDTASTHKASHHKQERQCRLFFQFRFPCGL